MRREKSHSLKSAAAHPYLFFIATMSGPRKSYHHKRGTLLFGRRKTKSLNKMRNGYNAHSYASILQTGRLIDLFEKETGTLEMHNQNCQIKNLVTCGYTRNNSTLGSYILFTRTQNRN